MNTLQRKKILLAGIYLSDKENHAIAVTDELSSSTNWQADLCWGR